MFFKVVSSFEATFLIYYLKHQPPDSLHVFNSSISADNYHIKTLNVDSKLNT